MFQKFLEQFPKVNFTLKNLCVQNIFAPGGINVVTAVWDVVLTNRARAENFMRKRLKFKGTLNN